MKTTVQTLISQIETEINKVGNGAMATGFDYGLKKAKQLAEELLEIEKEQKVYSEEQVLEVFEHFKMHLPFHYEFLVKEHLQQFKQQEQNPL
jgi:hypothetical protein